MFQKWMSLSVVYLMKNSPLSLIIDVEGHEIKNMILITLKLSGVPMFNFWVPNSEFRCLVLQSVLLFKICKHICIFSLCVTSSLLSNCTFFYTFTNACIIWISQVWYTVPYKVTKLYLKLQILELFILSSIHTCI